MEFESELEDTLRPEYDLRQLRVRKVGPSRKNFAGTVITETISTPYEVTDYLQTPEDMAAYLEATIEAAEGDVTFINKSIR